MALALEPLYPIIALVVVLLDGLLIYQAVKNGRRAGLLARLPWSRIGQLKPGLVKVQGRIQATGAPLRSPLLQRPCVYFHFQVQEKRTRGPFPPGGAYWTTVIDDAQFVPCMIHDGAGRASLTLKSAKLELQSAATARSGFLDSPGRELEATLQERYGYSSVGLLFNRTLHYQETRIEEGDQLVILGTARQAADGSWELVRGSGPLLISNKSVDKLVSSYRTAAFFWWCLALLLPLAVGIAVMASRAV
jgi:hypothetical protein